MSEEQTAEIIEEEVNQADEAGTEEGVVTLDEEDPQGQEGEEGGEGEQTAESGEIEIDVDEGEGSQPSKKTKSVQHRINKLNARNAESTKEADEAKSALTLEKEKNQILEMALAQKQGQAEPVFPNPDDFDGGAQDPQYKTQLDAYIDTRAAKTVNAQIAKSTQSTVTRTTSDSNAKVLETAAQEHWKRADKLGASDYEATEDKAREYLGNEIYETIIKDIEGSELLIYHFGKNQDKAEEYVAAVKKRPINGLAKIAALGVRLKVRPNKNKSTPNPDDPLEGGQSSKKGTAGPPGAKYS